MMRRVAVLFLSLSFMATSSGCAVVAGVAAYKVIRKASSGPSKLSEEERIRRELSYFVGTSDEVLLSTKRILENSGYVVEEFESEASEIQAQNEEYSFEVLAKIEEVKDDGSIGLRIIIEDDNGIVENDRMYEQIFNDIRADLKKE